MTVIDCGPPPKVDNTRLVFSNTTVESQAEYACHPNTIFQTNATNITCGQDGLWTKLDLVCHGTFWCFSSLENPPNIWSLRQFDCNYSYVLVIDCGAPPSLADAVLGPYETTVNSTVEYTCNPITYFYANSTIITCSVDGQWTTPDLICTGELQKWVEQDRPMMRTFAAL